MKNKVYLSLKDLIPMAIGNVMGAGAFTHIGIAIGYTGYSAWFAYLIAVVIGILFCCPIIIMTSALKLEGGIYTLVGRVLGKKAAGIYASGFLFYFPGTAIAALALGKYLNSVLPGFSDRFYATAMLTFFYILNLTGVKKIAQAQKLMVTVTIISLIAFILLGLTKISPNVLAITSDDFFENGTTGFFNAVFILFYSVTGYYFIMFQGRRTKNATKNIPLAMCVAALTILVIYPGIGIVAAGVLPLQDVANQPLTWVAREIFPYHLFIAFLLCGPLMALMSNINSLYLAYTEPIHQAATDGWFGKIFTIKNSHGSPIGVSTILWLAGIIPIVLNLDIATITSSYMLLDYILIYFMMFSIIKVPRLMPNEWENRYIRIPTKLYYLLTVISITIQTITIIAASASITPPILLISILIISALFLYAILRDKSGKVLIKNRKENYE